MKKVLIFLVLVLFLGCKGGDTRGSESDDSNVSSKELLIPVYFYDLTLWDRVVNANADEIAIINPSNGPGESVDSNYEEFIANLISHNKKPIGYVYTNWGGRDIDDVEDDIDTWLAFYPDIKGFFLDEVATGEDKLNYYTQLRDYIKSKGDYFIVLNPGTTPDSGYFDIADVVVVFENNVSNLTNVCENSKSAIIVYGANSLHMEDIVKNYECKYVYVTDDESPNPYDTLPSYFEEEIDALK